jgi:hypothetical protein
MTIAPPAAVGKGGYPEAAWAAATRRLMCLMPNSAYGNNAEASEPMAATITAHNPSEISNIAITAAPALRRRGTSGADRSDVAKPCRDGRSTG